MRIYSKITRAPGRLLAAGLLAASSSASAQLVINELDYDQALSDTAEFIELKNISAGAVNLAEYRVELVNGNGNTAYNPFVLPAVSLAVGDYYVICANAATTVNCDLDVMPNSDLIQNGAPDGLRIVRIVDSVTIDGMAYEGSMSCCTEGTPLTVASTDDGTAPNLGYSRFADGVDTNDNLADFTLRCISPGIANVAANTACPAPVGPPALSINDISVSEGNVGPVSATFTVTLSSPALAGGVSFDIATADGTATVANNDYAANALVAQVIAANQTTYAFTVLITGDAVDEPNETYFVNIANVVGATVTDAQGLGTIVNDDAVGATLSIATPAAISEGDAGSVPQNFTVMLGNPLASDLAFTATTTPGTATATDFTALAGATFTIVGGQTSTLVPVAILGDLNIESTESYTLTIATADPRATLTQAVATGTINDNDAAPIEIHAVQGAGLRSPLAPATGTANGQVATTAGNIVTAIGPTGFTIQTPDNRVDADPLTSQGIFVFTSSAPQAMLAVGDVVTVKGPVSEFFSFTQISGTPLVIETGTAALPTAVVFDQNRPSRDPANLSCGPVLGNFECYEGMLVSVPVGVMNSGNQAFGGASPDPFAEVFVSAVGTRARREAGVRFGLTPPASPATVPVFDGNPELFELDADRLLPANANRPIIGGSAFSATGVIGYDFGNHELWPTSLTVLEETLPRQVAVATPGQMGVASFNVLRLCDATNNATPPATTDPCLSPTPTASDVTLKLGRISDYIRTVLRAPDVIGVQEVENIAILQQLAIRIGTDGGPQYASFLAEGNDPGGIDVGFLVRSDRISSATARQLGLNDQITDAAGCSGAPPCTLHDRPPYLLRGTYTFGGANFRFAVINNHLRSRNGVDTGAETGRVRLKRFLQAQGVATFAQRFQTGLELEPANPTGDAATAQIPLLVIGDLNAFEVTDGWADLVAVIAGTYDNTLNALQLSGGNITTPPLLQASSTVPLEERYSYVFRESLGNVQAQEPRNISNVQIIDHALVNAAALPYFRAMYFGRTNADAPANFQTTGLGAVGVSDHDGFVIYIETADVLFSNGFEP